MYFEYTITIPIIIIMDTEILPPVAKKQLSIANFFGGANNAGPSINAEVER
jgi:hypothetical protein